MMYEQDPNQKSHPLTMAGNRHYATARKISVEDGAVVEADLAIAFEQRTANLLAFYTNVNADAALRDVIKKRLGL